MSIAHGRRHELVTSMTQALGIGPAAKGDAGMKVPSSRLLEAFVSMQRALDQEGDALQADGDAARAALAELVRRLGAAVAPASPGTLPASSVLDVSA